MCTSPSTSDLKHGCEPRKTTHIDDGDVDPALAVHGGVGGLEDLADADPGVGRLVLEAPLDALGRGDVPAVAELVKVGAEVAGEELAVLG